MKLVFFFSVFCAFLVQQVKSDCFFDAVDRLKVYDKKLCGRLDPKYALVARGATFDEFKDYFQTFKSNGTEFSCGYTRDWIMEMGFGLNNNYYELKQREKSHADAGYVDGTGVNLQPLFDEQLNTNNRVFYEMQIVGPLDHVWLIEQLPDKAGYRVYQSYNGAYSLQAWLAKNASTFDRLWNETEIIYWQKVYDQAAGFLKSKGLSIDNITALPSELDWMKPWLRAIKGYNKTAIIANLHTGWEKFGSGKIMSKEYFYTHYLNNLANMTEEIKPLVNTTKPWTQKLHDQWINLFASPNPLCYPNASFNTLTGVLSQDYKLEVKVNVISHDEEMGVPARSKLLAESVNQAEIPDSCKLKTVANPDKHDCFTEATKILNSYDKLLCGRLDPKKALIANGISMENFLMQMNTFKSNGTEFSCGYTRDWLMELAFGLLNNYNQLKENAKSHAAAGFVDATGNKLKALFDSKLNSSNRVFFQMQIVGPLDHVWLVEQLANGAGYRVYQSYNGAYSLQAWLTENPDKFDRLWNETEIIYWQKVYDQAAGFLKSKGLSIDDIDALPSVLDWMKPWLKAIKSYNKTEIIENLSKAWLRFGSGRTLSQFEFYEKYIANLAEMTEEIKPLVNTTKPWTQKLHDQWIHLFASPNPLCYPDAPFDTLTGVLSQDYKLEVLVREMSPLYEETLAGNAMILKDSVNYKGALSVCDMKKETKPPVNDCFFSAANTLKQFDKKLCGRIDPKNALIKWGIDKNDYIQRLTAFKSNGTAFACGLTRDWLMEMAFGLSNNYDQLKANQKSHADAGFVDATGDRLRELFDRKLDHRNRIFYQMQIVGPLDHVWLIEQLADGAGYRVYQSYNGAYSLQTWLEQDENNFDKLWDSDDIIYWQAVYNDASAFLKAQGFDIEKLDELPDKLKPMTPWLEQIKTYNKAQIIANLKKAWQHFGSGKTLSQQDFYKKYLTKLADMTKAIIPLVNTTQPWSKELNDVWIDLFASPNPLCFPGFPFNTLTGTLSQDYKLEVKVVEMLPELEFGVSSNAEILRKSVDSTQHMDCALSVVTNDENDCFFDAADGLKNYDKKLCGRLDPKNNLIRHKTVFSDFEKKLKDFKSNGTFFSCGYTRDWLMEMAFGLRNNFEQLTLNQVSYASAGFVDVTGTKLKRLFDENKGSPHRIFYQMQIVGPLDHVWLIEQLAEHGGYRVYQSYNGAYSLASWLEKDENNFGNLWDKKEIIYWQKVYDDAAAFLNAQGLSIDNIDGFPAGMNALKPWIKYIKNYNESLIIYNLKAAWRNFGAGKKLSEHDFYAKYLNPLADMSENIIPLVSSASPWTSKLNDQWINLFASPNPLCYPDIPFNTLTGALNQNYELQVKVVKMTSDLESNIPKGADILRSSVGVTEKLGVCNLKTPGSTGTVTQLNFLLLTTLLCIAFRLVY